MADLSITAADVIAASDATTENGTAGATITAGQTVYLDTATGRYELADADGAADLRRPRGVALNGAADGQPLRILKAGSITIGATVVAGTAYYQSPTPGGICPLADLLTGDYVTLVGLATSTTEILVDIQASGAAVA